MKVVVQVNGKVRSTIEVETDSDEQTVVGIAKKDTKVQKYLTSEPKKVIYVKNRLLNFVT